MLVLLGVLLTSCWCLGGGKDAIERSWLRHFADHAAIREAGRALHARYASDPAAKGGLSLRPAQVPAELRGLGRAVFVYPDHVSFETLHSFDDRASWSVKVWVGERTGHGEETLFPGVTLHGPR